MDSKYRQSMVERASKLSSYKNYQNPVKENPPSGKQLDKKTEVMKSIITPTVLKDSQVSQDRIISQERLEEAIIWSEILGKPVSKRRKRR